MNPMIIILALVVVLYLWYLSTALRNGEFLFRAGNSRATSRVRRDDNPLVYWILVAFNGGLILYLTSLAWEM
jgi:hypothetical protein